VLQATLAMELSSASMKVAMVTVRAMAHGLARGRQVSWKVRVSAAAAKGLLLQGSGVSGQGQKFRRSERGLNAQLTHFRVPD